MPEDPLCCRTDDHGSHHARTIPCKAGRTRETSPGNLARRPMRSSPSSVRGFLRRTARAVAAEMVAALCRGSGGDGTGARGAGARGARCRPRSGHPRKRQRTSPHLRRAYIHFFNLGVNANLN
jgi:hypothetical protein